MDIVATWQSLEDITRTLILYGEATMKCEKCKTDIDTGEWYQFYCGTLLASWTSYQRRYADTLKRVTSNSFFLSRPVPNMLDVPDLQGCTK